MCEVVSFSSTEFTERDKRYLGTLMDTVQEFLALALGRVGSMGIFIPLGFMMTGIAIDLENLEYQLVEGIQINGKGEEKKYQDKEFW